MALRSQAFRVFSCCVEAASIAAITPATGLERSIRRWRASQISVAFLFLWQSANPASHR